MKPIIIYHDHCTDGYGAAFAAWMKFGEAAEYVPGSYGQRVEARMALEVGAVLILDKSMHALMDRDVYILDFSFDRPTMDFLFAQAGKVVWLDHHKTAFELYGWSAQSCVIGKDIGRNAPHHVLLSNDASGALLAWEHFHPHVPVPKLIQCIDDRDRWVFAIPESKALHAGLAAIQPWTFEWWESYLLNDCGFESTVREGRAILQAQDANVARMAAQAMKCNLGEVFTQVAQAHPDPTKLCGLAVNASIHQSELGHVIATESGTYALVWYLAADSRANCSLRSNGNYDVSAIAKAFGGGGHKNAAGFQIDVNTLLGWLK